MKKLFASATYSFNNFYDNLNARGQMVFMVIIILIAILVFILLISYAMQAFKNKKLVEKIKAHNKRIFKEKENREIIKPETIEVNEVNEANEVHEVNEVHQVEEKQNVVEVNNIANEIEKALGEEKTADLTAFEEEQERRAIISIDELIERAKELEIIEDEETGVNYMEKYNLEKAEVKEEKQAENANAPIKSFKVSQVISPVYGVKKEVINKE